MMPNQLIIRSLGLQPYHQTWQTMREFTQQRQADTPDELWLLEHHPVFTQGQAGKSEHIINSGTIPIVQTDRGGQVTYHGPGQLVAYPLLDLSRHSLTIRGLVSRLEQSVIDILSLLSIQAHSRCDAPGVYIEQNKICSIGLRVRRGYSYHGIALNVAMDLTPFSFINPCGFKGLKMTQIRDFHPAISLKEAENYFINAFLQHFRYNEAILTGTLF